MLIDNKTQYYPQSGITTLVDFIRKYTSAEKGYEGKMDIVTGFFTVAGLSILMEELSENNEYRLILGNFAKDTAEEKKVKDKIINLLLGDNRAEATFKLTRQAQNALDFLKRATVHVRAVNGHFCHAKTYIYTDRNDDQHDYYVTGSANLTDSGLGTIPTANIELNMAETVNSTNNVYRELCQWFNDQWKNVASTKIQPDRNDPDTLVDAKQYFIDQIREMFLRKYTPEEIYYKILLELFLKETDLIGDDKEEQKNILHLKNSTIYNTLFDYQKQGVISLIKTINQYGGAILADAVGLGKTFSALAVMLYYQMKGYDVVLFCPKKLEQNWTQYLRRRESRFQHDEFDYLVRFHTDLQGDRMEGKQPDAPLSWLTDRRKILIVIDESHNLRNDKSNRYKMLMDKLVKMRTNDSRDVKILELSATPINNKLLDIRNQFKLIARGDDKAFNVPGIQVANLTDIFKRAQSKYEDWCDTIPHTIGGLINELPAHFLDLTDQLVVARTRSIITKIFGASGLNFPTKAKPDNYKVGIDHLGNLKDVEAIYEAMLQVNLTAYKPSIYSAIPSKYSGKDKWKDQRFRERFLVKMMLILFMKRLESSWLSCLVTMEKVLLVHQSVLLTVNNFINGVASGDIDVDDLDDEDNEEFSLGKSQFNLKDMGKNITAFKNDLEKDINILTEFIKQLKDFRDKYYRGIEKDEKLNKLKELLTEKAANPENKKIVVFTAYSDTAKYLYDELIKSGFSRIACVTGSESYVDNTTTKDFTEILQRFAPYSKLFLEKDWTSIYDAAKLNRAEYFDSSKHSWSVDYEPWKMLIESMADPIDKNIDETVIQKSKKVQSLLDNEIDILIATDCLSEGQNLQDADTVVNYDIHWNPVRLIQRFGRIDRLKSPNNTIFMINLWPLGEIDDYLKMEKRINDRMSIMTIGGSETIQDVTNQFNDIMKDDPMLSANEIKALNDIANNKLEDIEDDPESLSFASLSLDAYKQDLTSYFDKNKEMMLRMPNGVYSGFALDKCESIEENSPKRHFAETPESIVALVGSPHRDPEHADRPYDNLYLMLQPVGENPTFKPLRKEQILELLAMYKEAVRNVPKWVDELHQPGIDHLSKLLQTALQAESTEEGEQNVNDDFEGNCINLNTNLTADKFKLDNFDLIAWDYIRTTESNDIFNY